MRDDRLVMPDKNTFWEKAQNRKASKHTEATTNSRKAEMNGYYLFELS